MTVWLDLLQLADGRKLVPTLRPVPAPGAQFVSLLPGTFAAFRPKAPVKPAPWPEGEMPEHELIVATLPTTREQGAQLVDLAFLGADGPWPSGWRLADLRAMKAPPLPDPDAVVAWCHSPAMDVWCDAALLVAQLQAAQREALSPEQRAQEGLFMRDQYDPLLHVNTLLGQLMEIERVRDAALGVGLEAHGGADRPDDRARVLAVRVLAHEAVHVLKGHPAAHHVCGVAARLSGEWQEAAARFRHSTHLAPTVEAGWLELTWALAMLRDLDGALTAAQSALEHGDSAAGWSNLAAVRMERGEKDQARSALDKALAKGPQDWKLRTLDEQWRRRWPAT